MSSESVVSNDSRWTICLISKSSCILTSTSVAPAGSGEVDWHFENAMYPAHVFLVLFLTTRVVCGRSVKRPLAIDHKPDLQAGVYSDRYSWETRHTLGRLVCEGLEKNIPRKCYRSFMKWSCGRDSLGHDVKIMKRQESWKINDQSQIGTRWRARYAISWKFACTYLLIWTSPHIFRLRIL